MVSAVIPAFNEERTVAGAVHAALSHPQVKEVIVVDDGSTDATAGRAAEAGARVITLAKNAGKAGAMDAGVAAAHEDLILFLDADCEGFTHEKISRIIGPVIAGEHIMYVGINTRRSFWLNKILHFFPILSGSRALRRQLWDAVLPEYKHNFQIEIALNYFSRGFTPGSGFELIDGITHHIKESKRGLINGFVRRLAMIRDIIVVTTKLYILRDLKEFFGRFALLGD